MNGVSVEVVGKCGRCVGMWEGEEKCVGISGEVWGEPTHSSTPLPTLSALTRHLFHTPTFTQHLYPTPPHSLSHFPTPLPPLISPDTFPSPPQTLRHTSSQPPRLLQRFPILPILYHLPHTKISHFSHLLPN